MQSESFSVDYGLGTGEREAKDPTDEQRPGETDSRTGENWPQQRAPAAP